MPTLADLRTKLPELQGLDDTHALTVLHSVYYPDLDINQVAKAVGYKPPAPPPPGLWDRAKRGLESTMNAGQIALAGKDEVADLVAQDARTQLPQSAAAQQMQAEAQPYIEEANKAEGWDAVGAWAKLAAKRVAQFITNPREFAGMMVENMPNSLPGMAGSLAGAAAGGSVAGPLGAAGGALVGGTAGGYLVEQGAAMREQVLKEAQARGIDPRDPKALAPIIAEKYDEFIDQARLKGIGTAATDAVLNQVTLGLAGAGERAIVRDAGKLAAGVKAGTIGAEQAAKQSAELQARLAARDALGARVARGAGVTGMEMVGEGASEAAGQLLAYGEADAGDVVDESLLGLGQGLAMSISERAVGKVMGTQDHDAAVQAVQAAADAAQARIGQAKTADDAVAAFNEAIAHANDPDAALANIERLRANDEKELRAAGFADKSGLPPLPPQDPTQATGRADLVDAPFADRVLDLRTQLGDEANRARVRDAFGDQGLQEALYYLNLADKPGASIPDTTRERLLGIAEAILARATLKPMTNPPAEPGRNAFGADQATRLGMNDPLPQLGVDAGPPRIGMDTGPSGTIVADQAGNARPQTRAESISNADRARQLREQREQLGTMTPRGAEAMPPAPAPARGPRPLLQIAQDRTETGRLIAGQDGVRPELRSEQVARENATAAEQRARELAASLGLTPDVVRAQQKRAAGEAANDSARRGPDAGGAGADGVPVTGGPVRPGGLDGAAGGRLPGASSAAAGRGDGAGSSGTQQPKALNGDLFADELEQERQAFARREQAYHQARADRAAARRAEFLADDSKWRDSPLAPRVRAVLDNLLAAGPKGEELAGVMASGLNDTGPKRPLTEERVSFLEGWSRRQLADIASQGKRPAATWQAVSADSLRAGDKEIAKLPQALAERGAERMNELGVQLAKLGYESHLEVTSAAPQEARDLAQRIRDVWSSLVLLGQQRDRNGKGYKNAKPEKLERMEDFASEQLGVDTRSITGDAPASVAGERIAGEWRAFSPDSGTKGIPRADMPQVRAEHRGALVNFLNARDITHQADEVAADSLKPTQAEYSTAKVQRAKDYTGGERSILVSSDGHVLDGHHQWVAAREQGKPVKVIRLGAPIDRLLKEVKDFPSVEQSNGATQNAAQQGEDQLGRLQQLARQAAIERLDRENGGIGSLRAGVFRKSKKGKAQLAKYEAEELAKRKGALAKAERKAAQGGKRGPAVDVERDTLLVAVAKLGGIRRDELAREFGLKPEELKAKVRAGNLAAYPFRVNGGMSIDRAIERLAELGYLDGVDPEDHRRELEAAIFEELGGDGRLTTQGQMRRAEQLAAERAEEEQAAAPTDEEAAELADLLDDAGVARREYRALEDSDASELADDLPFDAGDPRFETDQRKSMAALGFTQEEIDDAIQGQAQGRRGAGAAQAEGERNRQDSGDAAREAAPAAGADGQGPRADRAGADAPDGRGAGRQDREGLSDGEDWRERAGREARDQQRADVERSIQTGQPQESDGIGRLAADGWRAAVERRVGGWGLVDNATDTDGRITLVKGEKLAHFYYRKGDQADRERATSAAEAWAKGGAAPSQPRRTELEVSKAGERAAAAPWKDGTWEFTDQDPTPEEVAAAAELVKPGMRLQTSYGYGAEQRVVSVTRAEPGQWDGPDAMTRTQVATKLDDKPRQPLSYHDLFARDGKLWEASDDEGGKYSRVYVLDGRMDQAERDKSAPVDEVDELLAQLDDDLVRQAARDLGLRGNIPRGAILVEQSRNEARVLEVLRKYAGKGERRTLAQQAGDRAQQLRERAAAFDPEGNRPRSRTRIDQALNDFNDRVMSADDFESVLDQVDKEGQDPAAFGEWESRGKGAMAWTWEGMTFGRIENLERSEGAGPSKKWRTSDGQRFDSIREAKAHEIATTVTERLTRDGFMGAKTEEASGDNLLTAQTRDELRNRDEERRRAEQADKREQQRLANKAKADAELGEFTLTGSDSPADIAAAAGQADLFSANEDPEPATMFDGNAVEPSDRLPAAEVSDRLEAVKQLIDCLR